MEQKIKNHGVIEGKRKTDYVAGYLPYRIMLPSGNWESYLPSTERQRFQGGDTMNCVAFSLLNCIETQLKLFTGEEINLSDRFLGKMSGTTRQGNWLYIVADALRKYGIVKEEDWPPPPVFTWEDYYSEIPQFIIDKARKFLDDYSFSYEWIEPITVKNLKRHLKHAPLQVVIPGHAVMMFYCDDKVWKYFDTYYPFIKEKPITELPRAVLKPVLILKRHKIEEEVKEVETTLEKIKRAVAELARRKKAQGLNIWKGEKKKIRLVLGGLAVASAVLQAGLNGNLADPQFLKIGADALAVWLVSHFGYEGVKGFKK